MGLLIYILDDDEKIREIVRRYLERENFETQTFGTGQDLITAMEKELPDCFVLDIMLPDTDGFELCRIIRKKSEVPIIFISARSDEMDKIIGLEIGGDDYMAKPFSPRELVARVKSVMRRAGSTKKEAENLCCGNLTIHMTSRQATCGHEEITLTAREYDVLSLLVKSKGTAHSREDLLKNVWHWEYTNNSRAVDDLIKRLRKKLSATNCTAEIKTIWGYGYRMEEASE